MLPVICGSAVLFGEQVSWGQRGIPTYDVLRSSERWQDCQMIDLLFARAQLAVEESQHLRHQSQMLRAQQEFERGRLRVAILEK